MPLGGDDNIEASGGDKTINAGNGNNVYQMNVGGQDYQLKLIGNQLTIISGTQGDSDANSVVVNGFNFIANDNIKIVNRNRTNQNFLNNKLAL
jgi:hypothetical protein